MGSKGTLRFHQRGGARVWRGACRGRLVRVATLAMVSALSVSRGPASAQPAPARITVGIFAPTLEFERAAARLAYAQALAAAIATQTGIRTEAQSYASLQALRSDGVDVAIVDATCIATNPSWQVVAAAQIAGASARSWALYASEATTLAALKGKTLAVPQLGCNDAGFVDHAMLESEVAPDFFGRRMTKADLAAAIAEVVTLRGAHAVFAPAGAVKGATKLLDGGLVPNPGLVVFGKLPKPIVDKVVAAARGLGSQGPISGWVEANRSAYSMLAARMMRANKLAVWAQPLFVKFDLGVLLLMPATMREQGLTDVRHHVLASPRRME